MLAIKFQNVTSSASLIVFGEETFTVNILQHLIIILDVIKAESTFIRDGDWLGSLAFMIITSVYLFCTD